MNINGSDGTIEIDGVVARIKNFGFSVDTTLEVRLCLKCADCGGVFPASEKGTWLNPFGWVCNGCSCLREAP